MTAPYLTTPGWGHTILVPKLGEGGRESAEPYGSTPEDKTGRHRSKELLFFGLVHRAFTHGVYHGHDKRRRASAHAPQPARISRAPAQSLQQYRVKTVTLKRDPARAGADGILTRDPELNTG